MDAQSAVDFNGGLVEFLNYGYEYEENLNLKGFIYGNTVESLILKNVDFSYNIAYDDHLISINEYIENFQLEGCVFEYTMCKNLIHIN